MKEIITILGKTTPVFDEHLRNGILCTTGINKSGEWRRLYPVPIDKYEDFRNWNILEIELVKRAQKVLNYRHTDYRPESRVINFKKERPYQVIGEVSGTKKRFNLIKKLVLPSQEFIKKQKNPYITIGIIQPDIKKVIITKSTQNVKKPKYPEAYSILGYLYPETKEDIKKKKYLEQKLREYAVRTLDIHFRFKCLNNPNCRGHNKQVLDDGLHQYIRKINREFPLDIVIQKTKKLIEDAHSKSWIFFGLGTLNKYPFLRYTIGSVFRFPKSKISAQEIEEIKIKQKELTNFF